MPYFTLLHPFHTGKHNSRVIKGKGDRWYIAVYEKPFDEGESEIKYRVWAKLLIGEAQPGSFAVAWQHDDNWEMRGTPPRPCPLPENWDPPETSPQWETGSQFFWPKPPAE